MSSVSFFEDSVFCSARDACVSPIILEHLVGDPFRQKAIKQQTTEKAKEESTLSVFSHLFQMYAVETAELLSH